MAPIQPQPTMSLYQYIWRHSQREQALILGLIFLSMPFFFMALTLPKDIVNHLIAAGKAGSEALPEQSFLRLTLDVPEILQSWFGHSLLFFEGVPLGAWAFLVALSFSFLALVCINGLFKMRINTLKGRMGERLLRRLRFELIDQVLRFPPRHLRKVKQSEVASMIKDEVDPLGGFIGDAVVLPVFLAMQALTALLFIFLQSFWLGLIALFVLVVQLPLISFLRRRLVDLRKARQLEARKLAGRVGEIVDGAADIHIHDTSNYERADMVARLGRIYQIRFEIYQRKYFIKFLNNFLAQVTPFIFYLLGGYLVLDGSMNVGQLVAVLVAYKDLPAPIRDLLDWDQQRQDMVVKYDQVVDQFFPDGMLDEALQRPLGLVAPIAGEVALKSLSVQDDSGFVVLEPTTLSVRLDEAVAVRGPTAGGKEAFGQAFARQLSYDGSLRLGGEELARLPEGVTGRRMAYAGPEVFIFPVSLKDNILYSLKNEPRQVRTRDPAAARAWHTELKEAVRAGNPAFDWEADWIDYAAAGISTQAEVDRRLAGALQATCFDDDVFQFGLKASLDPTKHPEQVAALLKARKAFRDRLSAMGGQSLVDPFDPAAYNRNATLAENIMFGTSRDGAYQVQALARNAVIRRAVAAAGLEEDLVILGKSIAETMVELFRDFPPDHPFFEEYSFVAAADLPHFEQVLKRAKGDLRTLQSEDRERLLALPFRYIDARHRLGIITDDIRAKVLEARRLFTAIIRALGTGVVDPYDPDAYNGGATLQDNVLFGRVAYGVAEASDRVNRLMRDVLHEEGLDLLVMNAGLAFDPGAQGKRLTLGQKQKLGLARALIKRPDLLVVNGALANVDDRQRGDIVSRVLEERRGRATIWVLNQDDLIAHFGRVLTFERGRLVSDSRPQRVLEPAPVSEESSAS